jgi:hypothetical protein
MSLNTNSRTYQKHQISIGQARDYAGQNLNAQVLGAGLTADEKAECAASARAHYANENEFKAAIVAAIVAATGCDSDEIQTNKIGNTLFVKNASDPSERANVELFADFGHVVECAAEWCF